MWLNDMKFVVMKRGEDGSQQWGPQRLGSAACAAGISPEHAQMVYQVPPPPFYPETRGPMSGVPAIPSSWCLSSERTERTDLLGDKEVALFTR